VLRKYQFIYFLSFEEKKKTQKSVKVFVMIKIEKDDKTNGNQSRIFE